MDKVNTVTIPAGQADTLVSITPHLDQLDSAGRTIALEILESPDDYVIASAPQAIMTIGTLPPPAWLVLLYVAAEDIRPEPAQSDTLALSLNEPARELLTRLVTMPPNPNLRVVVLFDGNNNPDSRILVRQPGTTGELLDVTALVPGSGAWPGFGYDPEQDAVELNTGRTDTLRSFITWARQTYPQAKYTMLSVIDHGGGWAPDFRGGQQEQPKVSRYRLAGDGRGLSIDAQSGRSLSTRNTGEVFAGLGDVGQFDLIFFDACLMGMVESAYEIQPYTRYFVAGQNLLWAELPYERYFGQITPDTTPRQLATNLVNDYGTTLSEPHTIAAVEMAQLPALRSRITHLAQALIDHLIANPGAAGAIRDAYLAAQKFDYNVNMSVDTATDGYVDLRSIAQEIRAKNLSGPVNTAADAVVAALEQAVLAPGARVKSGTVETDNGSPTWNLSRASGLSIYMPLGERDCRPTALQSLGTPSLPCNLEGEPMNDGSGDVRLYEDQFHYYANPDQLAFTRDAKPWSDLLTKLREMLGTQIREPTLKPGERTTRRPYLLQTGPLTATTGLATPGSVDATLRGSVTTGTWDEVFFEVTRVPGDYTRAIRTTQLITETISARKTEYTAAFQKLNPVTAYYYRIVGRRGSRKILGAERIFTTATYRLWFPVVQQESRSDLEVISIEVHPARPRVGQEAEIRVTIKNNGPGVVGPAFWVDLYVNPRRDQELKPNVLWNQVASLGAAWRVYGLLPGQTRVLSTKATGDSLDLGTRYSEFSRFAKEGQNQLVVLIDSYQPGDERGAVNESRENNNLRLRDIIVDSE